MGNVPNGPQNSSNNILQSPTFSNFKVERIDTQPSPIAPKHTPFQEQTQMNTENTPQDSGVKIRGSVDQELITKTGDLKNVVEDQIEMKNEHREYLSHLEQYRNNLRTKVQDKLKEVQSSDLDIVTTEETISKVTYKKL